MARTVIKFGINRQLIREARRDGLQVVVREALWRAALIWFKRFLPDHFLPSAPQKYQGDYTPRTKRYIIRKAKEHKERGPMIYSGVMRRTILKGTPSKETFKSPGAVRVRLRLPHARSANLWAGRRRAKSTNEVHNMHRELAAITDRQRDKIAGWVEKIVARIRRHKYETAGMKTETFVA